MKKSEYKDCLELKANILSAHDKRFAFSMLSPFFKFGVIVDLNRILPQIFTSKKSKQRYQDYAYKMGIKKAFEHLISKGILKSDERIKFNFFVDQHHTATDGKYELSEGLLRELKDGTYNYHYDKFFPPLFPNTESLNLELADSKKNLLVRASDIIANRLYYEANRGDLQNLKGKNIAITRLP